MQRFLALFWLILYKFTNLFYLNITLATILSRTLMKMKKVDSSNIELAQQLY